MKRLITTSFKELGIRFLLLAGLGAVALLLGLEKNVTPLAQAEGEDELALASGAQCTGSVDQDYRALLETDTSGEALFVGCGGFF